MRAVLDTNVFISAVVNPRGAPARVLRAGFAGAYTIVTTVELLGELEEVLARKFPRIPAQRRRRFLAALRRKAERVETAGLRVEISVDPDDGPVLEAAFAGRADVIVTGDARHLLPLKRVGGIRILSPQDFLRLLRRQSR